MKKKQRRAENYLDRIPRRNPALEYRVDNSGIVTLLVEWKGFYHKLAQKLFRKPRVSQIHMDELGSFVWLQIDGNKDVLQLSREFDRKFHSPEKSMARLIRFLEIMHDQKFITFQGAEK